MLSVLSPLSRAEDVEYLIEVGADEFYIGFASSEFAHLNKRPQEASVQSLDTVQSILDTAHKHDKKVFLALNERVYGETIERLKSYLDLMEQFPFDAYIVTDMALLRILHEMGSKRRIHLSSLVQVWNKDAIAFYLDRFPSIKRVIFSRDISFREMQELCSFFPKMEFEAFILNDWCYNVDGMCSSLHKEGEKIQIPYVCHREYAYRHHAEDEREQTKAFRKVLKNRPECFVCSMHVLGQIPNLCSVKIVGRDKSLSDLVYSVKFVNAARKLLQKKLPFVSNKLLCQQLYTRIYRKPCASQICQFAYETE